MPDKISEEKRAVLRAYGAEVLVCPTAVAPEDPRSYYSVARQTVLDTPGAWSPDQYSNPANPAAHYATTGPEIWRDTDGRVTHFVAGIGTGGTISGVGRYLKEVSGGTVQVIGADPEGSVYSGGERAAVPGRRRRRGHLADDLRHGRGRPSRGGQRSGLVRHDPRAGPAQRAAGRRVVRAGGSRGDAGGA